MTEANSAIGSHTALELGRAGGGGGRGTLTGLLPPALEKSAAPRLVTLASGMAYFGCVDLQNLQGEKRYSVAFNCDERGRVGEFLGPTEKFNMNGPPAEVRLPKRAKDAATLALWEASEGLTGLMYDLGAPLRRSRLVSIRPTALDG